MVPERAHRRKNRNFTIQRTREHTYHSLRHMVPERAHRPKNRRSIVPQIIIIHIRRRARRITRIKNFTVQRIIIIHIHLSVQNRRRARIHRTVQMRAHRRKNRRSIRRRARRITRIKNFTVQRIIIIHRKNNN